MKKFFIYFIYFIFMILLSACQSAKEGFTLKKKNNSDEFLVEKKNPLVMPPDYKNLPMPEDFQSKNINKNDDEFKSIINNNTSKDIKNNKNKLNIEKSILEKIN